MGFKKVLEEVNFELAKLVLFNHFLNSVLVFMLCYLIFGILSIFPLFISTIVALLFFIIMLLFKSGESAVTKVESKYSALREKLRTAADNVNMQNSVVDELQQDIMKDLGRVEDTTFFSERGTYTKILIIMLLAFIIVFSAPISFEVISPDIKLSDIPRYIARGGGTENNGKGDGAGLGAGNGEIYGQKSIAQIGSEEINIELKHVGYEINLKSVTDPEEREFEESYPSEIYAQSGESFEETIAKEDQELVKNYFKAVAEQS